MLLPRHIFINEREVLVRLGIHHLTARMDVTLLFGTWSPMYLAENEVVTKIEPKVEFRYDWSCAKHERVGEIHGLHCWVTKVGKI